MEWLVNGNIPERINCSRMLDVILDKRVVMALSGHKTTAMLDHYGKHLEQENDKVAEIANDMRMNGFDKSRPIIVTEAYIIVDGHSRFMAAKKADSALLEKIQNGSVSINKAYEMIKAAEARKKSEVPEEVSDEKSCNIGKGINSESFKLGVLFVLSELERGRKKGQILKDKRIARLELGELALSEEDAVRISQRFGIA
ncbi:hypothetical protein [Treponema sp.]|uniref:hypothetical protein n=1 Tax=Treponema sp. TaxID=166 RepID=UPI003FD886E3